MNLLNFEDYVLPTADTAPDAEFYYYFKILPELTERARENIKIKLKHLFGEKNENLKNFDKARNEVARLEEMLRKCVNIIAEKEEENNNLKVECENLGKKLKHNDSLITHLFEDINEKTKKAKEDAEFIVKFKNELEQYRFWTGKKAQEDATIIERLKAENMQHQRIHLKNESDLQSLLNQQARYHEEADEAVVLIKSLEKQIIYV